MKDILIILIIVVIAGGITGFFVWLLWPIAIPAAFPALIKSGAIAAKLTLWQSICLSWIFAILIKSSQTNKK